MYEAFFDCRRRPFPAAPHVELYFPGRTIEAARLTLERCLARAEGAALVVGPAGIGKTLLCLKLAERFEAQLSVVQLSGSRMTSRRAWLQAVAYELGLAYRDLEEGELRLSIADRLTAPHERGMLLVVDEAHAVSPRLLEEVRLLADATCGGESRVRLVLAGAAALEDRLSGPRLQSLQQRITARCYLEPFDRNDTLSYVRRQIARAGGDPTRIFTDAALDSVFRATDGIPRLINQTCDHALLLACAGGVRPVDASGIEEAWADLQQLPTPWSSAPGYSGPAADAPTGARAKPAAVPPPQSASDPGNSVELVAAAPSGEHDPEASVRESFLVIESRITEWNAEFTPAPPGEPEVELTLDDARRDPFSEDFVQEEPIVDRYAAADRLSIPRASVYGTTLLHPAAAPSAVPKPQLRVAAQSTLQTAVIVEHRAEALPAAVVEASDAEQEDFVVAEAADDTPHVALHPGHGGDADMIILENDAAYGPHPVADASPVRKQDYRQLFARLRRGT